MAVAAEGHHQLPTAAGLHCPHLHWHHMTEAEEEEEENDDGVLSSEVHGDLCLSDVPGVVAEVENHHHLLPTAHDLSPPA